MADAGPYTTIEEDFVIAGVPHSLPANENNFFGYVYWNDYSGHRFIDSYMRKHYAAEIKILNDIQYRINSLHYPNSALGNGLISATLTWGNNTDLDLHIYEPNGTHVYYANMYGYSGYLDRDDVDGYGPEHYFASCNTIEAGTYKFAVNYYNGSSAETGAMTLQAGGKVIRTRQASFTYPKGSSGNSNPYIMFELDVTGSQENGFEFVIR